MPLSQNVSGTLKKIAKPTQNVSGVLKGYNSYKMNVSGVLKELLDTLPSSLTWTADCGFYESNEVTINSITNNGLHVGLRMYNSGYSSMVSSNLEKMPRIYSNSFYIEAGKKIAVTVSGTPEGSANAGRCLAGFLNVDTGDLFSTNAGGYTMGEDYVIETSGNYCIIASGCAWQVTVTGTASGPVYNYDYRYMNITVDVTFS